MLLGKMGRDIGNFIVTLSPASVALDVSLDAFEWRNILFEAPISLDTVFWRSRLKISQVYLGG